MGGEGEGEGERSRRMFRNPANVDTVRISALGFHRRNRMRRQSCSALACFNPLGDIHAAARTINETAYVSGKIYGTP